MVSTLSHPQLDDLEMKRNLTDSAIKANGTVFTNFKLPKREMVVNCKVVEQKAKKYYVSDKNFINEVSSIFLQY